MARGTLGTGMMAPLQMANNFHGDYYAGPSGAAMGALMASQAIGDGFRNWGASKGRRQDEAKVQEEKDRLRMDELNQRQAVAQAINPGLQMNSSNGMSNRDMTRKMALPDASTQMGVYKLVEDKKLKEQAAMDDKYSAFATHWYLNGGAQTDPNGDNFRKMTGAPRSPFEYIKESVYNAAENRDMRRDVADQADATKRELAAIVAAGKSQGGEKEYKPELFVNQQGQQAWVRPGEPVPQGFFPHANNMGVTVNSDGTTTINTGGNLKSIPNAAVSSLTGNFGTLSRIDESLKETEKVPHATNYLKGVVNEYAPNVINRIDPDGAAARAALGDLGSTIIHDRSGAAVTASEYPRLRPFIPTAYDDAETVKMKLKRFRQIVAEETRLYADNFNEEMGYKRPKSWDKYLNGDAPQEQETAPSDAGASSGISPEAQVIIDRARGAK